MLLTDLIALEPIKKNLNPMSLLNQVTLADFAAIAWNSLVICAPTATGFLTALAISRVAHHYLPKKRDGLQKLLSGSVIVGAFIVGSNASYMVAAHMKLVSFSADKAIRLATLGISIPAVSLGWYGRRALYVWGSLGALYGALYKKQNEYNSFNKNHKKN